MKNDDTSARQEKENKKKTTTKNNRRRPSSALQQKRYVVVSCCVSNSAFKSSGDAFAMVMIDVDLLIGPFSSSSLLLSCDDHETFFF